MSPASCVPACWQNAVRAEPGPAPLLSVVAEDGRIAAAAVLACRRENGILKLGARTARAQGIYFAVIGSLPAARRAAIAALAGRIAVLDAPWRLHVTGLDKPTAELLGEPLPNAQLHPAAPVPYVQLKADGSSDRGPGLGGAGGIAPLLSRGIRRQLRRSDTRIAASGLAVCVRFTRDPLALLLMRDGIAAAHISRDHDVRRPCDLDHPADRAFWHTAYNVAAAAGGLEVATLSLGGEMAAYTVALAGPSVYAVFDSRMVTRWAPYSPGRRLEADVLRHAARSPGYRIVDWMLPGEAGLLTSTGKDPRLAITAAAP